MDLVGCPVLIISTRPNIVKASALIREYNERKIPIALIHTGQHYDHKMSDGILDELNIAAPDYRLNISGSFDLQRQEFEEKLTPVLNKVQPSYVMVFGDVNGACLSAGIAHILNIPVAHVEAGLRSFDDTMQEEHNRKEIDHLAEWLFVTEESGMDNLEREGIELIKCHLVGNVMIDTLIKFESPKCNVNEEYAVWTIHRPSNVDHKEQVERWMDLLRRTAERIKVKWFLHPRTEKNLERWSEWKDWKEKLVNMGVEIYPPTSYISFQNYIKNSKVVITDSGGLQEEVLYFNIPCLTLRNNTERPVTLSEDANVLIEGLDVKKFTKALDRALNTKNINYRVPENWDGKAAQRIVNILHPN